jgi:exosortase A-associated hydrolase 2
VSGSVVPFFLDTGRSAVFCVHHRPPGAGRGAVVHVPAFAEEMNKSRRMVALQARALAARGWHVLQLDLSGTGDSEGDFADARWSHWLQDIDAAREWLERETGHQPWLWGLRLGALLAVQCLARRAAPGLLAWQPVASGRQHLQQFLRLSAGADWIGGEGAARAGAKPLDLLSAGMAVEVGGYLLDPGLALPMAEASFSWPTGLGRAVWLEVSPHEGAALSPASERVLTAAPAATSVDRALIRGASFWQSQEIEVVPALLDASCEAVAG